MNPLDTGEVFSIEFMNPDVSLRTGKDGPNWRWHATVTEEVALLFANANLKGMVLEMQGRVVADNKPIETCPHGNILICYECTPKEEKPKGGPISKNAGMWCKEDEVNDFARSQGFVDMKGMVYVKCSLKESRAELDHSAYAASEYKKLKCRFYRWAGENEQA